MKRFRVILNGKLAGALVQRPAGWQRCAGGRDQGNAQPAITDAISCWLHDQMGANIANVVRADLGVPAC